MDKCMLDPVTYEVIKHRLWQVNDEQSIAIRLMSSAPHVVEGGDFNVGLLNGKGEIVVAGAGILLHVSTLETMLTSVIREAKVISPGDVFLVNDPYMGALHQNDIAVLSPLFVGEDILLWTANVLHYPDVGGMDEGSFCVNARNVFQEAPRYFLKIVQNGRFSHEVERTVLMNSRLPDSAALELRAQLGAINVGVKRYQELVDHVGPDAVRETMSRSLDDAENAMRKLLSTIPDGQWAEEAYMDGERVFSERVFRVKLVLTKNGEDLFLDYSGSDAQVEGPVNATLHACQAASLVPFFTFLCGGDIDWNSGVRRCLHVNAPAGTVVNCRFPAAVSACSIGFTRVAMAGCVRALAQMLSSSGSLAERVCPSWSASSNAVSVFAFNEQGKQLGTVLSDHRGTGAGARSFADGIDHAGMLESTTSFMPNVESQEYKMPILYAFRKRLVDSGGAGKFRGGLSTITAILPFRTERLIWKSMNTAGTDQANSLGIGGGFPGAGSQCSIVRGSGFWKTLEDGRLPRFNKDLGYEDLGGRVEHLTSKSEGTVEKGDVFVFYTNGGGGFGDPLERDPLRVETDVLNARISPHSVSEIYGVVLDGDHVDELKTVSLRNTLRGERSKQATRLSEKTTRKCGACGHLSDTVLVISRPVAFAGPWVGLRTRGQGNPFTLEMKLCERCGTALDTGQLYTPLEA